MNCPPGYTEEEVLRVLDEAVGMLADSFTFGYFDVDDIRQEGYRIGLKALADKSYDPSRPLPNFLYVSIKNGLVNLRRDKYRRSDPPCLLCHQGRQAEHQGGQACEKYRRWKRVNDAKANLTRPQCLDSVADESESRMRSESSVPEEADVSTALLLVDRHLPVELRSDYLRMRAGESVPKCRREKVEAAVLEILRCQKTGPSPGG